MDFLDLVRGALLHDIGKFIMRAGNDGGLTHQEIGLKWLSEKGVSDKVSIFALRHHAVSRTNPRRDLLDVFDFPSNELLMVYEADNLSSGERPEKKGEKKWQRDIPLMSVFSKISSDHEPGKPVFRGCWRFYELGSAGALKFPGDRSMVEKSYSQKGYADLLSSFEKDFIKTMPELSINALLLLLEKHTLYIPSETRVVEGKPESYPDVSLFDHLKTTAAIAVCIYRYLQDTCPDYNEVWLKDKILNRDDPRYMLVGADLSGIQKFIYTISSKGALKTLRARSFFLELLTEHVIAALLEKMDLPRTNVIYSGGGRSFILAPNTKKCNDVLEQVSYEINDILFDAHRGQLYLALEKVVFAGRAFLPEKAGDGQNIAGLWEELRVKLNQKKSRKFTEQIKENPDVFWTPQDPNNMICAVCHNDSAQLAPLRDETNTEDTVEACLLCKQLYELGDELPGVGFIACCATEPESLSYLKIGQTFYVLVSAPPDLKRLKAERIYVINSWRVEDYLSTGATRLFHALF